MRLIDADALLAKFNKKADIWSVLTDGNTVTDSFALYCEVADAVDELPTVGDWISVKDRLPKLRKPVLVCYENYDHRYMKVAWIRNSGDWETGFELLEKDGVTHWMPLPEPPKEVTGNERD